MENILFKKQGKKVILLGNEAIVRGALEAGVQFVSTYPGTPASEIGDSFYKLQTTNYPSTKAKLGAGHGKLQTNYYFEYSTNEKVALEAGMGASFSGLKTLVAMKHFGLNVCQDALVPFVNAGCVGPTVIVVADDPGCHSSAQSEQNSRAISYLAHIPTLEPSSPQECKDFVKLGFRISEEFKIPVLIRTTTRVAHQRTPVKLSQLPTKPGNVAKFVKNKEKFVTMPQRVFESKKHLFQKIEKIKKFSERSKINQVFPVPARKASKISTPPESVERTGIICSGVSYLYVMEALKELNISLPILKLGLFYPLPELKIKKFIKKMNKVLIVEELESWLEKEVAALAKGINPKLKIFGKNLLPQVGELTPDLVIEALAKFGNKKLKIKNLLEIRNLKLEIPRRMPRLCPNCPYWLTFGAVRQALKQAKIKEKDIVFGGDIGCYMLAGVPPLNLQDYLFCMGSSIGIGHGIKKAGKNKQRLIAFIGDSTFFHAGIPALINTVFNKSNPLIIIMDNQITAMTGQQPHPGRVIKIEEVVKGCGVKNVKVIDPVNQKEMIKTIKQFLNKKKVSVIVARHPCRFVK